MDLGITAQFYHAAVIIDRTTDSITTVDGTAGHIKFCAAAIGISAANTIQVHRTAATGANIFNLAGIYAGAVDHTGSHVDDRLAQRTIRIGNGRLVYIDCAAVFSFLCGCRCIFQRQISAVDRAAMDVQLCAFPNIESTAVNFQTVFRRTDRTDLAAPDIELNRLVVLGSILTGRITGIVLTQGHSAFDLGAVEQVNYSLGISEGIVPTVPNQTSLIDCTAIDVDHTGIYTDSANSCSIVNVGCFCGRIHTTANRIATAISRLQVAAVNINGSRRIHMDTSAANCFICSISIATGPAAVTHHVYNTLCAAEEIAAGNQIIAIQMQTDLIVARIQICEEVVATRKSSIYQRCSIRLIRHIIVLFAGNGSATIDCLGSQCLPLHLLATTGIARRHSRAFIKDQIVIDAFRSSLIHRRSDRRSCLFRSCGCFCLSFDLGHGDHAQNHDQCHNEAQQPFE